jgi:hypothetical protein
MINNGERIRLTARDISASMRVPGCDYVFAVIPAPGLVTFHSQQRRAFNLLWSLRETDIVQEGSSIAVVGAGLAGICAAAAAQMLGCDVTLFEAGLLPFHEQRGNFTRYIHPNILDWPRPGATNPHTSLPYLNWTADRCKDVIGEIEAQWETISNNIKLRKSEKVSEVSPRPRGARITVDRPFDQISYDCIIICVGFGKEKPLDGTTERASTYWENDALHQIHGERVLVSGTGDGGLVDFMRLMIADFDHGRVLETLATFPPLQELKDGILQAEDSARTSSAREAGATLMSAYGNLHLESAFPDNFRASIRSDARVTLNGTGDTPFVLSSSILNRVITYAMIRWGVVEYIPGRLLSLRRTENKLITEFDRKPSAVRREFDRVVIRHGPGGQFAKLFGPAVAEQLRERSIPTAGREELWPAGFFALPAPGPKYLQITHARAGRFLSAFEEVVRGRWGSQASIVTRSDGGHATYVVNLPEDEAAGDAPSEFARIPIVYVNQLRLRPDSRVSTTRYRPLVCGIGIQNYDLASRQATAFSGTLGCFVETSDGRPAFLSTLHVLAGDKVPHVGDLIVQAPGTTDPLSDGIARLHSFVPILDQTSNVKDGNVCDVGLAALLPGVEFVPAFPPEYQLPLPKPFAEISIDGETGAISSPEGGLVWVVGSASGPKRGYISDVGGVVSILFGDRQAMFVDCLMLASLDKSSRLTAPGDSGSLVIRDDGAILGMTFAGTPRRTLAFPLDRALNALNCRLIAFNR